MGINRPFQPLRAADGSVNWVLKQEIERDICLLYHQLADYAYIMGDLYYGSVFSLPYWEYLDVPDLDGEDHLFIRDGCLVMILAMAWDQIDGSGAYIGAHTSACRDALARIACEGEDTRTLVRAVTLALDIAERAGTETPELVRLSGWVHERYVRAYFRGRAQEFDRNPYYGASGASGTGPGPTP